MQKLPTGIQHFNVLRQEDRIYVDKTEQIYQLMEAGKFLFLTRPRRFGKSLLLSTLYEIYRGNRALFTGLWIEDKIDWLPHPVILLNFNDLDYRSQPLADSLAAYMDRIAAHYQIALQSTLYKDKFAELIETLATDASQAPQKVILLIDEYDKAITDLLEDDGKVSEHIDVLKNFYSVLKSSASEYIQLTLLTGISKYGKLSIFSDLNNLIDLTVDDRFATLLGYTQEELEHYFADYLEPLREKLNLSPTELLNRVQRWYDGYSWDGKRRVYVPFSTLLFLEKQRFENHWFSTGTPSFVVKLLRQQQIPAYELREVIGDDQLLESADVNSLSALSLLFHAGYLTIKEIRSTDFGAEFTLGYPNFEVTQAFQQVLLADYLNRSPGSIHALIISKLQRALSKGELQTFVDILNSVFASIPHTIHLPYEAYYHSLVYLILSLLGFKIYPELITSQGRIDAVLELPDKIYILEFKMSTAQIALDQIKARSYDQPYRSSNKRIILIGIAFDKEQRKINDWKSEP